MRIYIDVDETICRTPPDRDYATAEPIKDNIDLANELYEDGHEVVYWTARGSVTGADWRELTEGQLNEWGCKRHKLEMGKPSYDLLIDDKTLNARVWEDKGNNVVRRVFLQSRAFAGISPVVEQPQPEEPLTPLDFRPLNWPKGVGFANENSPFVEIYKKGRWCFQGEFPNDVVFPPSFVRVDKRPSLILEEEKDENGWHRVKPDSQEWQPVAIHVYDIDTKSEFMESLANVSSCMFDDKSCEDGHCIGSCRLTLYDGSGIPRETWVFDKAWFQGVEFHDLDHSNSSPIDVSLTLRYDSVRYMQVNN